MKVLIMTLAAAGVMVVRIPQASTSPLVNRVTSALDETFESMDSVRNNWLTNYSHMKDKLNSSSIYLNELTMFSKMVSPLLWYLNKINIKNQKEFYPSLVNESPAFLPFHAYVNSLPNGLALYIQTTILLQQYRDFQIQIFNNKKEIFFSNFQFNERRVVMGHILHGETVEEVVLADEDFPAITINKPFNINIQVADDCIVASIWPIQMKNFHSIPKSLPEKHIWCTRDYSLVFDYEFKIHALNGHSESDEGQSMEQESDKDDFSQEDEDYNESQEEDQEQQQQQQENSDIKFVSVKIYNGLIF